MRWSGSVTTYHCFLLLSQTYVLGNVWSELFFGYGWSVVHIFMLLFFLQQTFILLSILPYSKGIFHIGGLVSKMHISVLRVIYGMEVFFLHLLSTILGL